MSDATIRLLADTAQFEKAMASAEATLGRINSVAGAFGVTLGGAALSSFVADTIEAVASLHDLSLQTGVTIEDLSAIRDVAEMNGASMNDVGAAYGRLIKTMSESRKSGSEQAAVFKALGVSAVDTSGKLRGSGETMIAVAKSIADIADPTERAAAAQDVFGKSGASLIPMLLDLAEKGELQAKITAEQAARADIFSDALTEMRQGVRNSSQALAVDLLPAFAAVADVVQGSIVGTQIFGRALAMVAKDIETAVKVVGAAIGGGFTQEGQDYIKRTIEERNRFMEAANDDIDGIAQRYKSIVQQVVDPIEPAKRGKNRYSSQLNAEKKAIAAEVDEIGQLLAKLYGKSAGFDADYAKNLGLLSAGFASGRLSALQYAEALARLNSQQKFFQDALKAGQQVWEDFDKATEEFLATRQKTEDSWDKQAEKIEFETSVLNLSNDERERAIVLHELEAQKLDLSAEAYENLRQRLEEALANRAVTAAGIAAQADFWRSIDNVAHQTFDSIADGNKNLWERMKQTGKNIFFDWLWQMTARKWLINLSASVSGVAATEQAFGAGSVGNAGSLVSTGSSAYNLWNSFSGATGAAYSTGAYMASGMGYEQAAMLAAQEVGLGSSATAATLEAAGSSFLSAASSFVPYIAAATAILSMMDWGGGTPHKGANVFSSGSNAISFRDTESIHSMWATKEDAYNFNGDRYTTRFQQDMADALTPMAQGMASSFNAILKANGLTGGYTVGLGFAADGDDASSGVMTLLDAARNEITDFKQKFAKDAAQGMADFGAEAQRALLAALEGMDLNDLADTYLDSLDIDGLSADAAAQALQFVQASSQIIDAFKQLGLSAGAVSLDLINALGGLDAAGASLSAYYAAMYSDDERRANAMSQIEAEFAKWNATVPTTVAGWRALTEQVAASGPANADALAALIKYGPAFAEVKNAGTDAVTVVEGAADSITDLSGLQSDLIDAYEREAGIKADLADKMRGYADSLRDFRQSLLIGDLSPLDPLAKYEEAQRQYQDLARRAQIGDTAAIEKLQGGVEGFLTNSKAYYGANSAAYSTDFFGALDVLQNTETLAERQARIADEQLAELKRQVGELVDIDGGVQSVAQAIAALQSAQSGAGQAGGGLSLITPAATAATPDAAYMQGVYQDNYLTSMVGRVVADPTQAETYAARAAAAGFSADQIAAKWSEKTGEQMSAADLTAWARERGIRGFATGGIASGLFTAHEVGPELIYSPSPVRVLSNRDSRAAVIDGGQVTESIKEMSGLLREVVVELRAGTVQRGAGTVATIERLEAVADRLDGVKRAVRNGTNG